MSEKVFADGFRFDLPGPKAPAWVKGRISIKADEAIAFIEMHKNEKGWVSLDLKESKGGKQYLELNTWKPTGRDNQAELNNMQKGDEATEEISPEDIPF